MKSPLGPLAPLGGERFQRIANVLYLGEVPSTNDVGRALVERMVAEETDILPTCIVAGRQTAGKGRSGRSWAAAGPGAVAVSLVTPWPEGPERIHVPVATGISLARSLSRAFGIELRLKWPNDLLAGGRKVAGILVEGRSLPEGAGNVVIGIGLNVAASRADLDALDLPGATSLELEGAVPAALEADAPLLAVLSAFDAFLGEEPFDLPSSFAGVTVHRPGDLLEVRDGDRVVSGRYAGLSKDGLLRLETAAGVSELISGDVTSF
ncbi:MAG: biotin--[acetyl-CoA-carboxylase] ligase [Holophagales bacterium]|nr:biotin--[acetyl-CoA-carboxylase] ligase [Holophagales bacterium]